MDCGSTIPFFVKILTSLPAIAQKNGEVCTQLATQTRKECLPDEIQIAVFGSGCGSATKLVKMRK